MREIREEEVVEIVYTNHRGETRARRILPMDLYFGTSEWHDEPQWLLSAVDVERGVCRTFAMKAMRRFWRPAGEAGTA